jgi:hypothetical protein
LLNWFAVLIKIKLLSLLYNNKIDKFIYGLLFIILMNESRKATIEYPIQIIKYGDFPLLDEVVIGSNKIRHIPDPEHGSVGLALVEGESMRKIVERAMGKNELEPLASLCYFIIPANLQGKKEDIPGSLLPYQQRVDEIRRELSQNISFEVQHTPGNDWDGILANGLILFRSGGNVSAHRYSVQTGKRGRFVRFEKLPNLQIPDLESAIGQFQDPTKIESHVLAHSTKPYSSKNTVLPHFAYNLIGLGR